MFSETPLRTHGGVCPPGVIDFSTNISPFGVPAHVERAIRGAALGRYPDPTSAVVRAAYAERLGLPDDRICFGPGAAQLLWDLARLLSGPGQPALVIEPTFSEFRAALQAVGAETIEWRAQLSDGLRFDLRAVAEFALGRRARLVYLCNPNNPSGKAVASSEICELAERLPQAQIVLDEAFLSLSECCEQAAHELPANVVRVRSMTKDLAVPGLRVAYLLGSAHLVRCLERQRAPWSTSSIAQAAAMAALEVENELCERRAVLLARRARFASAVEDLGLDVLPSVTTWFLARTGAGELASEFNGRLGERGFHARDCASFGLPQHLRFGVRSEADMVGLLAALGEVLSTAPHPLNRAQAALPTPHKPAP